MNLSDTGTFQSASPFPHVVIDDFIDQKTVHCINAEWPDSDDAWRSHNHKHSRKRACSRPQFFGLTTGSLIEVLNSLDYLRILEGMTGIAGLVADEALAGGGLHETLPGGFLDIHADFNIHPETRLHRRLNLLLYLNEDWNKDWGGRLEQPDFSKADRLEWIFGDPSTRNPLLMNKWAYTPETLTALLNKAGYRDIAVLPAEHHVSTRDFRIEAKR